MGRASLRLALRRLSRSDRGLAAVEVALAAPLLALLLLGGYDLSRLILARNDVDKVVFSVADVTSQYRELNPRAMQQIFQITGRSLTSYRSGENGVTIVTSTYLDESNVPRVRWQCYSSAGTSWKSKIGAEGGKASVAPELLADTSDNIIISEIYYTHKPMFTTYFTRDVQMYAQSLFRPRLGALTSKPC